MSDSASKTPRFLRVPLTPARVKRLILLTLLAFGVSALRGVILAVTGNETPVIIDGEAYTPIPVPLWAVVITIGVLAVFFGVVIYGLRKRHEWSRTLGTIVNGAAVLGAAGSALGAGNPITTLIVLSNVLVMGVGVTWIYVAWWNREPR